MIAEEREMSVVYLFSIESVVLHSPIITILLSAKFSVVYRVLCMFRMYAAEELSASACNTGAI